MGKEFTFKILVTSEDGGITSIYNDNSYDFAPEKVGVKVKVPEGLRLLKLYNF